MAFTIVSAKANGHQIGADIFVPSSPNLIGNVLTSEQIYKIYTLVGYSELNRISFTSHENNDSSDWNALAERERLDLAVLHTAIIAATNKTNPWIIGFASDFASGLLALVNQT